MDDATGTRIDAKLADVDRCDKMMQAAWDACLEEVDGELGELAREVAGHPGDCLAEWGESEFLAVTSRLANVVVNVDRQRLMARMRQALQFLRDGGSLDELRGEAGEEG